MAARHQSVDPFGSTTDPEALVARPAVTRVLEGVQVSLLIGKRRLAITGPDGIGKTLILHALADRVESSFEPVYLPYASLSGRDLCAWILTLRDEPIHRDPVVALEEAARRAKAEGRPLLVLIDDASSLLDESVRLLGTLIDRTEGALRVVVAPTDDFRSGRLLAAFGEGLEEHRIEQPMTENETRDYLMGRLTWAGAPEETREAFTPSVVAGIHQLSGGVPGPMNALAARVLRGDPRVLDEIAAFEATPTPDPSLSSQATLPDEPLEDELVDDAVPQPEASSVALELKDDLGEEDFPALREVPADEPVPALEPSLVIDPLEDPADEHPSPVAEFTDFSPEDAEEVADDFDEDDIVELADEHIEPLLEEGPEDGDAFPWQDRIAAQRPWLAQVSRLRATVAGAVLVIALLFVAVPLLRQAILDSPSVVQEEDFADGAGDFGDVQAEEAFGEPEFGVPVEPVEETGDELASGSLVPVNINAEPWAHVEVDGIYVGLTPLADVKLTPGAHQIRARLPDGEVVERWVTVDSGNRHIAIAPGEED